MRAACVQCRVRKVRCDGSSPCCRPCERLHFDCSFQHNGSGAGYAPQLPPKRRGAEACLECRSMKVRCSRDSPRCNNCQRRNKTCTYASACPEAAPGPRDARGDPMITDDSEASPFQASSLTSELAPTVSVTSDISPVSPVQNLTALPDEAGLHLITQFFECLSPLPSYSFLHKDTVIQRCLDKSIDRSLELAIYAIASMFLNIHHAQRKTWAQESENLILDRLEKPSIFLLQASLLTIRFRAAVGQFPRAFILAGLAARWAVALRLNYEHNGLGPVAQEVRRRTLWSLYLLEDSFCVGLKEFELLDPETIYLQLPCEDEDFNMKRPPLTGYLLSNRGLEPEILGIRGALMKLTFIRRCIMRFNRRICAKEITQSELFTSIERFQNDLLRVRTRLAPCDQYPRNDPGSLTWLPQYALLHISWHQCHCDLYRIFLTGYPELGPHAVLEAMTTADRGLMKEKCLGHAEQIIQVLSDFVHHKEAAHMMGEHDLAVCAYHAARLILFGTFDASHESDFLVRMATNKATLCLEVITRYFGFSAQLKTMREALEKAIEQHKKWWKPNAKSVIPPADAEFTPPRVTKDAHNRQRLAIHSLLRQSDFVDDSREAALEPQDGAASDVVDSTIGANVQDQRLDWSLQENPYAPWTFLTDPAFGGAYSMPIGMGFDMNTGIASAGEDPGLMAGLDEQGMY